MHAASAPLPERRQRRAHSAKEALPPARTAGQRPRRCGSAVARSGAGRGGWRGDAEGLDTRMARAALPGSAQGGPAAGGKHTGQGEPGRGPEDRAQVVGGAAAAGASGALSVPAGVAAAQEKVPEASAMHDAAACSSGARSWSAPAATRGSRQHEAAPEATGRLPRSRSLVHVQAGGSLQLCSTSPPSREPAAGGAEGAAQLPLSEQLSGQLYKQLSNEHSARARPRVATAVDAEGVSESAELGQGVLEAGAREAGKAAVELPIDADVPVSDRGAGMQVRTRAGTMDMEPRARDHLPQREADHYKHATAGLLLSQ